MSLALAMLRQESTRRSLSRRFQTTMAIALLLAGTTAYAGNAIQESQDTHPSERNLYLKVKRAAPVKLSALEPGDVLQGYLTQDVFSGDHKLFASGSSIKLTVERLERRRRAPNDHWPWLIKVFTPRHEKYPTFNSALATGADGNEIPLQVSLISIGREVDVQSPRKIQAAADKSPEHAAALQPASSKRDVVITLQGTEADPQSEFSGASALDPGALLAGTQVRVVLLNTVSASRNHVGDVVQARLIEPIWSGTKLVLPEGALLQGHVAKSVRPRMLSRAGSLHLEFTDLTPPGSATSHIAATLSSVQADPASHFRIDPEGTINAGHPGKAWMMINLGATGGIAKVADDGSQLLVEALVSTATDASTAGTARIVASCVSGIFMLTRHGRDVVLPKFAELRVTFDRSVSFLETRPESQTPPSNSR